MRSSSLIYLVLAGFNLFIWQGVFSAATADGVEVHFLDVGQGDSQLVSMGDVDVLIDGGVDKEVLFELSEVLGFTDRYIDLVVLTHAQLDHFGGMEEVLKRYRVGAFAFTGREGSGEAWERLTGLIREKEIRVIILKEGDSIRYTDSNLSVLSPGDKFIDHSDLNEASLVILMESEGVSVLFTGDVGFEVEDHLIAEQELDVDVLKVGHHGSRYSSGLEFLRELTPAVSVIGVGGNRYGHPTESTLQRLRSVGSSVYRTNENGRVSLTLSDGLVGVSIER